MGKVITVDGPSGAGKSTIAKRLARSLGFEYLDTGALYRAIALGLVRAGLLEDAGDDDLSNALSSMMVEFSGGEILLNGENVSGLIRTTEIGHFSSVFSARKQVRDFLMPAQRASARSANLVAEGRDMGTVVFPHAELKVYLVASVEARAERRRLQLADSDSPIDMQEAMRDVTQRDERDSSRDISPLKKADDALEIDSSGLSIEDVLERIVGHAKRIL